MTDNRKLYRKSLGIAALIETVVLAFTILPVLDGFMVHSAIGATQRPLLMQFLGWFGFMFHLPSILLLLLPSMIFTFGFMLFVPVIQTFILSGLVYVRFCVLEKRAFEKRFKNDSKADKINHSEKDEVAGRYWL